MDKLPVGQLPDLQQSNNDDEIMVITNSEYNQLKKEKISDLITDFTSTNENNALTKGTDGKMFVTDFGNASNITEGTLPTSVLPEIPLEKIPDIPKDKLPPIETSDLPVSGVSADTYAYPSSVTVNAQGQVTAIEEGTPSGSNANTDLSNITEAGKEVIRQTAGTGLPIGSLVAVDRVLSFAESKGLAQLGSYVYKDAVPGSRYGYPDFYNDCVEKLSSADNVNISVAVNVHNTGCVIDSNFIVSGFSSRNFIQPTSGFYPSYYDGQPFEVGVKLNTTTMTGIQSFLGGCDSHDFYGIVTQFQNNKLRIGSTNNGTSWNLINLAEGTKTYDINTDYWFKLEYTGTQYIASWSTDGQTYTPDITVDQSVAPAIRSFCLGNNLYGASQQEPLQGTIDIKECYIKINNELVWQGTQNFIKNTNGHILYDISQKPTADYLYNTYGACWAYGVDTENERIFLPRNDWFFQSGNADNVGRFNEAGLPNITGTAKAMGYAGRNDSGALYTTGASNEAFAGGADGRAAEIINLDASRCQDIYGKSTTVQPPSVNQIVYMVVGNTEVESAATDIVDVTTTENDTIPLFTGMYYDFKPNNSSWLKAGQQANNGGLYSSAYNKLVNELTSPVYNLKVIDVDDMESNVDYSEYWKVDQTAQTFTTPTRLSYKALTGGVVGTGMALGITDGTNNGGLSYFRTNTDRMLAIQSNYGQNVGNIGTSGSIPTNDYEALGVTTDSTKSGIIAEEAASQLYFKVMNAVENQDLINLGEITEALADKTDMAQAAVASAPSNKRIELALGASGQSYTLPATGFLCINKMATAANQNAYMQNNTNNAMDINCVVAAANHTCACWCWGQKGDSIKVDYSAAGLLYDFCFIYAEGVKND